MRHVSKEEKERRIRGAEGIMNTKTNEERPRQSDSQVNDIERIVMDVWMGICVYPNKPIDADASMAFGLV